MSAEPQTLARNTSYFTLALVAQKVISFLYFTFLARTLGPATMGKYQVALSLTTIFSVLLDLGLANVLIREVARDKSRAEYFVRLVFGFKMLASLAVMGLVVLSAWAAGYPSLTLELVAIASVVMVLDSFTLSAYSTIRGFQNLFWESIGTVLMQAAIAVAGLVVSRFTHDVRAFMAALLVGVVVNTVFAVRQLHGRFRLRLAPLFAWAGWRTLFTLTWPFALAAGLTRVYGYLDQVMLSLLSGDVAVGVYSVAYKVTFAFQFIPTAFSASLYPAFSAYYVSDKPALSQAFSRAVVYLSVIGIPISWCIAVLAPAMVRSLYPAYHGAIVPLQILMLGLPFLFASFPVGALLPACNRQTRNTANIGLVTLFNIVLNLFLIPRLGPLGAAVSSVLSTVLLLSLGWMVARQLVRVETPWLLARLGRVVLAGLVMAVVAWWLEPMLHWSAVVLLASGVYLGMALALQAVTTTELKSLRDQLLRRTVVAP